MGAYDNTTEPRYLDIRMGAGPYGGDLERGREYLNEGERKSHAEKLAHNVGALADRVMDLVPFDQQMRDLGHHATRVARWVVEEWASQQDAITHLKHSTHQYQNERAMAEQNISRMAKQFDDAVEMSPTWVGVPKESERDIEEIVIWCEENCADRWKRTPPLDNRSKFKGVFMFEDKKTAALAKMMFG